MIAAVSGLLLAFLQDPDFRIPDPAAECRVDYLVVAADPFAGKLGALAAHRAKQGLAVGIVALSDVRSKFPSLPAFLAHAAAKWGKPAPAYLLLVGDHDALPAVVRESDHRGFLSEKDLATDFDYGCPSKELEAEIHVGRFPCDTPEELEVLVRKTIDYETRLAPGDWQKKIDFIAGEAGFSKEVDAFIEKQFTQLVCRAIPAAYDIEVAFASPRSPYCPFPPRFHENALRLLNEGALFYVYVGHGARDGVDTLRWREKSYEVLQERDAVALDVRSGLPVLVVIACSTGQFDHESDCIGERFFKNPKGPVAFLGGSRVTQPYGNGLLGQAMIDQVFGESKTLGEALTRAKLQTLRHEKIPFTRQSDLMALMMHEKDELPAMRRDVVRHYNLLGDPALVLRKPAGDLRLSLDGRTLTVEGPDGDVRITLECPRDRHVHPPEKLKASDPELERKSAERYRAANDKVLRSWTATLTGGKVSLQLELPEEPPYLLKASSPGHAGSLVVDREK